MMPPKTLTLLCLVAACGGGGGSGRDGGGGGSRDGDPSGTDGGDGPGERWMPTPGTSWQWQLSGTIDTSLDVDAYDIDLFDTPDGVMDELHGDGRRVVCYFDTAYEPGRPDSDQLEPYRGNQVDGWPGQYWLDVREPAVVAVMHDRLALAADRDCDAVEADDVDARSNEPGFDTSAAEQQAFIRDLAVTAHELGLSFALKNDLEEVGELEGDVDFAVNEECFTYDECDALAAFIDADKAVFQVEYTEDDLETLGDEVCPDANARDFDTLIKRLDLDAPRYSCR
jgi:hypothetical protein